MKKKQEPKRPFYTTAEIAELFQKDVSTIHNWILAGKDGPFPGAYKMPPAGIRQPWLVPTEEVESLLEKERDQSAN